MYFSVFKGHDEPIAVGEIFIMLGDSDDRAGGVFMGILIAFPSIVIATAMVVFERVLQNAVDIKSENDLMCRALDCEQAERTSGHDADPLGASPS